MLPTASSRDRPELIRAAFADAMTADMVLSTGGVSVGSFDYVRRILAELGYEERFWKVAQKPGKPLTFGLCGRTPVFGLPGNPVSSLVCFYLYALPALRTMMGLRARAFAERGGDACGTMRKAAGLTGVRALQSGWSARGLPGALDRHAELRVRCARCRSATRLIVGPRRGRAAARRSARARGHAGATTQPPVAPPF